MVCSRLRILALVAAAALGGPAPSAEACWWLHGGGWGVFRPVSWGSYYGGGWGGSCCSTGSYYGGGCSSGCCGTGGCNTGCCGTQSYYGPACDTCGSACGGACGATGTYSNCCTQYNAPSTDPVPDNLNNSNTSPGTDSFGRSRSGTGSGTDTNIAPRSSIPNTNAPAGGAANPPFPALNDSNNYNPGRGINDSGVDALPFELPGRSPAPIELDDRSKEIKFEIEPVDPDSPVSVVYRAPRERVRLWSSPSTPHVVAKALPAVNAGWEPVRGEATVASR